MHLGNYCAAVLSALVWTHSAAPRIPRDAMAALRARFPDYTLAFAE